MLKTLDGPPQGVSWGAAALQSSCVFCILANDTWMTRSYLEQRQSWPFRTSTVLLPIPESMHADPDRFGKLSLRKADELAQCNDVRPVFQLTLHETPADSCGNGSGKCFFGEFGDVSHVEPPEYR